MLKTLLGRTAEGGTHRNTFLNYIIAVSFRKMNKRMKRDISAAYFNGLLNLTTFPFSELPYYAKADHGVRDRPIVEAIPVLVNVARTKIPNLEHAAKLSPNEIYNENTCIEFHLLLCELLTNFKQSLEELQNLERLGKNRELKLQEILNALTAVRIFGYYLTIMARSSAMEIHLQTIATIMEVDTRKLWKPEPQAEEDADSANFHGLQPYSMRKGKMILPWQSYRDWLMLMVHCFNATDVLVSHIKALDPKSNAISISILSPPNPDKKLLTWTELLGDECFFPAVCEEPSGKDFIKFLKNMTRVDDVGRVIGSAERLQGDLESNGLNSLNDLEINTLAQELMACLSDDCHDSELDILSEKVFALKGLKRSQQSALMQKILYMLNILKDRAVFYYRDLMKGPLNTGKGRKSLAYHCEAFIATLLLLFVPVIDSSGQPASEHVSDFKERLDMPSKHDLDRIEAVLDKIKVHHAFMHCQLFESLLILTTGMPICHRSV